MKNWRGSSQLTGETLVHLCTALAADLPALQLRAHQCRAQARRPDCSSVLVESWHETPAALQTLLGATKCSLDAAALGVLAARTRKSEEHRSKALQASMTLRQQCWL